MRGALKTKIRCRESSRFVPGNLPVTLVLLHVVAYSCDMGNPGTLYGFPWEKCVFCCQSSLLHKPWVAGSSPVFAIVKFLPTRNLHQLDFWQKLLANGLAKKGLLKGRQAFFCGCCFCIKSRGRRKRQDALEPYEQFETVSLNLFEGFASRLIPTQRRGLSFQSIQYWLGKQSEVNGSWLCPQSQFWYPGPSNESKAVRQFQEVEYLATRVGVVDKADSVILTFRTSRQASIHRT